MKILDDPKIGAAIATATGSLSATTIYRDVTDMLGIIGVLLSALLSTVLIINHWRIGRANHRKIMLEISMMRDAEDGRLKRISERRKAGEPLRRADD